MSERVPDRLPLQRYDVARPDGIFEERYWNALNTPVINADGQVEFILHSVVEVTDQVLAEKRVRQAQKAAGIGTFEWLIPENRFICTPEQEALYGLPEGGWKAGMESWSSHLVPEDRIRVRTELETCMKLRLRDNVHEFRVQRPDGTTRWLRGQVQFFYDESGNPQRMIGANIDIEAQKQAEAEHSKSKELLEQQWRIFDTALSHTPDHTYIFDLQGRITYANTALLKMWQKSLEETRGKSFYDLNYPRDLAERVHRQIQQVIDTVQPIRDHTGFDTPSGHRYFDYIFVPVLGPDGTVKAVAGSTRDITERSRMERALAESEQRLQQVLARAPVAIVVFRGRDLMVEMANPTYEALLGNRELIGRRFAEVVPELPQYIWDAFTHVFDTGETFVANEWPAPYDADNDGAVEDHWFNVAYNALRDADGAVSGIVAVSTDVTAQVLARKELERVNRELEEFSYVASHDLQEPLRMVNIYSQLLLRAVGEPSLEISRYAGFIRQGVDRMETLLKDLLTFSRAVHAEPATVGTASLTESLQEALAVLHSDIEHSGAVINADPLPVVRGDIQQMAHVFQNLLSNAIKYRRKEVPAVINIAALNRGSAWTISVADNGIGFDQQYAERIFGLFKRLHRDEYPGTGLGLAICQRIIARYGGKIWAEGHLGQGSIFHFTLPEL
jgi:PAS domain S-box-containing protein